MGVTKSKFIRAHLSFCELFCLQPKNDKLPTFFKEQETHKRISAFKLENGRQTRKASYTL